MAKVLFGKKDFFVKDSSKDYHTQYGVIRKEDLAKPDGTMVKTPKGGVFTVLSAQFVDMYRQIKRGAQLILPKDIGFIIAETGINSKSVVVDAGAGSGGLCLYLAHIVKKVVSYEMRDDFIAIVKKNKEFLGLSNIMIKKGDVYENITERNIDLVTLDVPEPWRAVSIVYEALKIGAFLVSYSPNITQSKEMYEHAIKYGFRHIRTVELIERDWDIDELRAHPKYQMLGHTGFISVFRKLE